MGDRASIQVYIGLWHTELTKEYLRHAVIVAMTGMNYQLLNIFAWFCASIESRAFMKGKLANYAENLAHLKVLR